METRAYHTPLGKTVIIGIRYNGCGFTVWEGKELYAFADTRAEAEEIIAEIISNKKLILGKVRTKKLRLRLNM